MKTLQIALAIGIVTLFAACSEKVGEGTLKDIEARLSAIENIDARISSASKEKALIEIELREIQEAIERFEAQQLEAISRVKDELEITNHGAGHSAMDINRFIEEVREMADENAKLKAELARFKSIPTD